MDNKQEKRNAKGGGTVRQRPDGRWEARCTINGKRRSLYADTQKEAMKLMRAAQKDMDDGTYFEPSKVTVGQWLNTWLSEYKTPILKPNTLYSYRLLIKNHIVPSLGDIKLQALSPTQIQAFYNDLSRVKNLSPKTVKHIHAILHNAFDQALKLQYVKANHTTYCTLPKQKREEISPLSDSEIEAFLIAIQEKEPLRDLFTVTLFTGMRLGEVCGLPWDAVNFKCNTITVKQQLLDDKTNGGVYVGSTKNGKSRVLTVAPFIMEILRKVRQEQLRNSIRAGAAWDNHFNLVFTNKMGKYFHSSTVWWRFKRVAARIGRSDARFHDLRHTYAVMALQEGDSPKTVQQNLGHSTANFTMNVYAHVSEKMKQESADRMQAYYEKVKA